MTPWEQMALLRASASEEASKELAERGFSEQTVREWSGPLDLDEFGSHPIVVRLPPNFPDALPHVLLSDVSKLGRVVAHVDESGKVCTAPDDSTLVDTSSPRQIVGDVLDLAKSTLLQGLRGENEEDFIREFLAYWNFTRTELAASLCEPSGKARAARLWRKSAGELPGGAPLLVADSDEQAKDWMRRVGVKMKRHTSDGAFWLPLAEPLPAPRPSGTFTVSEVLQICEQSTNPENKAEFEYFIRSTQLPYYIFWCFPGYAPGDSVVAGVHLSRAAQDVRKTVRAERREGSDQAPREREVRLSGDESTRHVGIHRLDPDYLLPRGGGARALRHTRVLLVGVGAVGSAIADLLASAGVGCLHLVDGDKLATDNVHRHSLGMAEVGTNKARGMADLLRRKFPYISVPIAEMPFETVLKKDPDTLEAADVVVFATGNHTFELTMNEILGLDRPRIHAWVEPLGIGGHVLACGPTAPGCLRCLYWKNGEVTLANRAALLAPGQDTTETVGGCSGTFTPFSRLDALRTAIEAAQATISQLHGAGGPLVITWCGDVSQAKDEGFEVSQRAGQFRPGEVRRESNFVEPTCRDCGAPRT